MRPLIKLAADRKKGSAILHCAVVVLALTACAGQKEFQKGYDRGASDTVKRQYWIQQNMQKTEASKASPYHLTLYRIPVTRDPKATVKTVPHEITIPIYE
jgi:hypothetical protein